jgi:hypothetical protein
MATRPGRCAFCSTPFAAELLRFTAETPDGVVDLCAACIPGFCERAEVASEVAGEILERMWSGHA